MTQAPMPNADVAQTIPHDAQSMVASLRERASGDPDAALALADMLSLHPHLAQAGEMQQMYQASAQAGSAQALAALAASAMRKVSGHGLEEAHARWRELAHSGYAQALLHYGFCLRHGVGCAPTPDQGLTQYLTAAAQGNTTAFALLADLYQSGDGAPASTEAALAWRELAALRHFPGQPTAIGSDSLSGLGQQIKSNIQGLGARIGALNLTPEDPQFQQRFADAVKANFAELRRPELALDVELRRSVLPPASDIAREPVARTLPRIASWSPRVLIAEQAVAAECCIHLLATWPELQDDQEFPLPLSTMSPAAHLLLDVIANQSHLPLANFEAPQMSSFESESDPQYCSLQQADRLAKSRLGDYSGRRVVTAWLVLATTGKSVEARFHGPEQAEELRPGDLVYQYAITPDSALAEPGIASFRCDGRAWMLRVHICERRRGPAQTGDFA